METLGSGGLMICIKALSQAQKKVQTPHYCWGAMSPLDAWKAVRDIPEVSAQCGFQAL